MIYPDELFCNDINYVASSGRFLNIAQMFKEAQFQVEMIGLTSGEVRTSIVEGIPVRWIMHKSNGKINDFIYAGRSLRQGLTKYYNLRRDDIIVFYGTTLKFTRTIYSICKNIGCKPISIVNEWGRYTFRSTVDYLLQKAGIRYVRNNFDGVIVISKMMESYFKNNSDLSVIRIPSIFDLNKLKENTEDLAYDSEVKIFYAGSIKNKKDSIDVFIRAFMLLSQSERNKIRLDLFGPSNEEIENTLGCDVSDLKESNIYVHGFLSRDELNNLIPTYDFSVLLRPSLPYSNAGFPTKFAEAFCNSVAMIANLTSDLGLYMVDNINGIIVADDTIGASLEALKKISSLDREQINSMRQEARTTGNRSFDLRKYIPDLKEFVWKDFINEC